MVWIQASRRGRFGPTSPLKQDAGEAAHVEDVALKAENDRTTPASTSTESDRQFPFAPESLSDDALPFIPKELVLERGQRVKSQDQRAADDGKPAGMRDDHEHWIVIDNVVFDCSDFISEHPGGQQVILSFVGEDCSWQFWRLHGKNIMEQYGRALRIGRTEGIKNRFVEPVRYVGLSKLGDDGW
ncbi:Cytochrome b5-like Heme/Steroid binding domain-containing protein isoform 2 [Cladophialophora immunda]|nr:Cytochrome b5-like Heme/Steroid binding domain-containing protein isoform 1 [Cladophialophora immunda]OQV03123.1 Cytochrome b5-like Heme/Steroid binding domain-containing protein isoform 2 [Cladophialophora immunda]